MSITSFFHTILSGKLLIPILIIELLSAAACGMLLAYFFAGMSANWTSNDLQWDFEILRAGALLGALVVGPAVSAVLLFGTRHFKGALVALLFAVVAFLVCFRWIPSIRDLKQAKLDAAPAEVIAQRAIDGTDKSSYEDSVNYALMVGHHLSIYEGTDTRLSAEKEKEVAERTGELLIADTSLSPRYTSYAWKTNYLNGKIYYYSLNLYCDDGHYISFYRMDKERFESLGMATPPETEDIRLNLEFQND
ncbi:MAG: hypothetical protein J6Z06_05995 [Lachnospiraceae bacterium]|nr:hypothetical protein [Lachnospiraceae bacterium]